MIGKAVTHSPRTSILPRRARGGARFSRFKSPLDF